MSLLIRCLSVLSLVVVLACQPNPKQKSQLQTSKISQCEVVLDQGLKGKIIFLSGNHMPSQKGNPKMGTGVSREIGIFELTNVKNVVEDAKPGFYKSIQTKKVKSLVSDADGCFAISLPPGRYSMFVKEEEQWYANDFTGDGDIFEVVVLQKQTTEIQFKITHKATF